MPLVEPDDEVPDESDVPELLELPVEPEVPGLVGAELEPLRGVVDNGVSTTVRGAEPVPEEESDDDEPLELGEVELLLPEDG